MHMWDFAKISHIMWKTITQTMTLGPRSRKSAHARNATGPVTCNISGYKNVVIGKEAGNAINTGCYNTAFGYYVWKEKS